MFSGSVMQLDGLNMVLSEWMKGLKSFLGLAGWRIVERRLVAWGCIGGSMLFAVPLAAQDRASSSGLLDSLLNPKLATAREVLHFDKAEIEVGELSEDDPPAVYQFVCWNVSASVLCLTEVVTTCGCTEAHFQKTQLLPGEEGTLTLVFDPKDQAGPVYKPVFIYTGLSAERPTAKIALTGYVAPTSRPWSDYPYVVAKSLRVRQPVWRFSGLPRNGRQVERLVCVNSGKRPLKLAVRDLPPYVAFWTEPEIIAPGAEADLVLSIDARRLPSDWPELFGFSVNVVGMEEMPEHALSVKVTLKDEN